MKREELIRLLKAAAQPAPKQLTHVEKLQKLPLDKAEKAALVAKVMAEPDPVERELRAEETILTVKRDRRWKRILKQAHENASKPDPDIF